MPRVTSDAWHLARRATLTPTIDIVREIEQAGIDGWLNQQLNPGNIVDSVANGLVEKYYPGTTKENPADIVSYTGHSQTNFQAFKLSHHLVRAVVLRQVFGRRYLLEAMTEFFSDQIFVSARGLAEWYVAHFNQVVLRRHALGRFSDLLYAALTHPGPLAYLNNNLNKSFNPTENLGRELLELHTVGVGNYTEQDVKQSAKILTGHTFNQWSLNYVYNAADHDTSAVTVRVTGGPEFNYPAHAAADGPAQLRAYANYLATHPATAKRLALRLCRRFVSDTPPQALVDRLAGVYTANGTDLKPVLKALFTSQEFKDAKGQKWKRPQEAIHSMLRAARVNNWTATQPDTMNRPWDSMNFYWFVADMAGHLPRWWGAVDGYPDTNEDWLTSGTLRAYWYAAESVGWRWGIWTDEWSIPPIQQTFPINNGEPLRVAAERLTWDLTGWRWADRDLTVVESMLYSMGRDAAPYWVTVNEGMKQYHLPQTISLIMASPYFSMR
ncbi:DUF1800 domain-containing protein [Naumannella sp. ID2617S]|nr:DUF1800 domain-containing protein [Naumannella sp. ID2617S]